MLKSKLRRKAERLYSDKIYRRCDINKELNSGLLHKELWHEKYNEDNKLRIEINLLDKLLRK